MIGPLAVILATSVSSANPSLDEGRKHYEALRYPAAEAELRLAVDAPTSTLEELHEASDLLARALAAQGRMDEARAVYANLLVKSPHAAEPKDASPKIRALFEDAKRRLYPPDYVLLKVLPAPPGRVRAALVDPWVIVDQVRVVATHEDGAKTVASSPRATEVALQVPSASNAAHALEAVAEDGALLASAPLALPPLELLPASATTRPAAAAPAWPAWAGGATAVASGAGGITLLLLAENDYSQAGGARRAADIRELDGAYRQKAIAGQVLLGVSTVAIAATVYLLLR